MCRASTLVQLVVSIGLTSRVWASEPILVGERTDKPTSISPTISRELFFDPLKNGVHIPPQKIDYDLSKSDVLRLGPFLLDEKGVEMRLTREQRDFTEIEFGLERQRHFGSVYVVNFKWPIDYIPSGNLEIIDDKGQSLWRRNVSDQDLLEWQKNPQHRGYHFGLTHRDFFELPISQITKAFRFCLSRNESSGRLALCSRRYAFRRKGGRYSLDTQSREVKPRVLINDKAVTEKGSAIFIDNQTPIKFSAILANGTYFEFVARPKDINVVDVVFNSEKNQIEFVGFGDSPMGPLQQTFYADIVHFGYLNFMPTIGDLRKFWRATARVDAPYLYLKGEGGVPFRQNFEFDLLPPSRARLVLDETAPKTTYSSHTWVKGTVAQDGSLATEGAEIERLSDTEFHWRFPAPEKGVYNSSDLSVTLGDNTWRAHYEIYRGYPAEVSARTSGVLTSDLKLVLLGELAGQYWFERLLGWENTTFSKLRWGVAAKYFEAFLGTDNNLRALAAGSVDLKYRFTPGIWQRDPTVGLIASFMNFDYGFEDELGSAYYAVPVAGGGLFWARSMPKLFDDFFNIVPFLRYPKWVDWEVIYYPLPLREKQSSNFMLAVNFHGKVQWTRQFFGEAGFGLKNFSFSDSRSSDPDKQLSLALGVVYGTVGIGFNF